MKRVALLLFLAGWLVPLASAQDQFQAGVYGDYFRISQTSTNMAGLGGRIGYKAFSYLMLEGEVTYDFDQGFIEHCVSMSHGSGRGGDDRLLEGHLGPIGLRMETGDEVYFAGHAHNNVRVAFGPFLRF